MLWMRCIMMTSSNENIFRVTGHLYGEFTADQWIPHQVKMWLLINHDDVIKWKHFPRYWPFVRGIHWSPVNSPHKGQWRRALMFSLICVWINGWVNNREAGDLRRYCGHYEVIVMYQSLMDSPHKGSIMQNFGDFLLSTRMTSGINKQETCELKHLDIHLITGYHHKNENNAHQVKP